MKQIVGMICGLWLMLLPAFAQDSAAIEDVIGSQLDAFNDRDLNEAWQYASPKIQRMFDNPLNFGLMVQQGYPMVWDNADVQFLELRDVLGRLLQRVMLRDSRGQLHMLEYEMINTPQGWQIDGVMLLQMPDVGA